MAAKRPEVSGRLSGLRAANAAREKARLDRMAALTTFANEARTVLPKLGGPARRPGPGMSSKEIARDFIEKHPQPKIRGRSTGHAGALRMLIELERMGFVRRRF